MPTTNKEREMRIAQRRVEGFAQQFGEAHRHLARHAAFPLVLTPDVLYQIWANFVPEAPWTAVAHVLLSRLCRQVGYEMYEMDISDRNLLLRELKEQFGQERFDELGEFLLDYVAQRLTGDDPDTQDLAQAQEWTALAYTKPLQAARQLAEAFREQVNVKPEDMGEVLRLGSLMETLADPLLEAGFEPLLVYSRGMECFVRGNFVDAATEFSKVLGQGKQLKIAGINLPIPKQILRTINQPTEQNTAKSQFTGSTGSKSVVLSLDRGNLRDGFASVTVHIGEVDNPYRMKFTASLPAAPEIPIIYQNLQLLSSAFYQRLCWRIGSETEDYFEIEDNNLTNFSDDNYSEIQKAEINNFSGDTDDDYFEIEDNNLTNFSEIELLDLCQVCSKKINAWLGSTEFRKIEQQLRTQLKPSEEISFIIETDDNLLRRLPWHLWEFFDDYPNAEVALSSVEYQKPNKLRVSNLRERVKILAILGNSKGIDINQDRSFLENLSNRANIQFLVEPNTSQLNDQLWQQGWDILFFAGHSLSKEKGLLQINQTDTIDLEQLRYALKQAISRGLKLAIFNSCDGLKLAQHLQDLYIPQVIVMREPVPDFVAQEFLKYFLDEFSSGKSLYAAVRSARERLQGLEKEYPCASWLPVIFQNPAEPPMIWSQIPIRREAKTGSSATVFTVEAQWGQRQMRLSPATQVLTKTVTLDSLFEALNQKLLETQNRPLNSTDIFILRGIWQHKTYSQIAQEGTYSLSYLTKVLAPKLYQLLSDPIGKRVTKKNCRTLLASYALSQDGQKIIPSKQNFIGFSANPNQETSLHFPNGAVPLDSPFYIKQSAIQTQICEEIGKPGALIRIKAPRERGKSSMLLRILDYAERQKYRTVSLNLEQVDSAILSDLNRFLRWLCASVSSQLQLEPKLDEYWDEDVGSKVSCTVYFRSYVLEQIDSPVILALDEVNQILEYPQVAKEIFSLLRSWYEKAKQLPIWQKLRQILVHSTEIYVPLQLNQSPFNVGLPIELTDFSLEQVDQLAQLYELDWKDGLQARQLMDIVGGHPGLVHLALYHLKRDQLNLATLLETAPTSSGIYHHHFQRHWVTLQQEPELATALHTVINATKPVPLEPIIAYKLSGMGLIKLHNNQATISCQLYREYFSVEEV